MARPARSAFDLTRQGVSLARSGVDLARKLGSFQGADGASLLSPGSLDMLGRGGNALGALGGAFNAYGAATGPGTDAQRALGTASGLLSTADAGAKLAGLSGVPGGNYLTTGLDIGSVIASDMPDEQKAFNSAAKLGELAASASPAGPLGGLAAGALTQAANHLLFPESGYAQTRRREVGQVPNALRTTLDVLGSATTLDELNAIPGLRGAGVQPELRDGRFVLGGHHLDTGGLDAALNGRFQNQAALIQAAQANPGGPEAQTLLQIAQRNAQGDDAMATIDRLGGGFIGGSPMSKRWYGIEHGTLIEDAVLENLLGMEASRERFLAADQGRTPTDAAHVASMFSLPDELAAASDTLGLDLIAAAQRRAQRLNDQARMDSTLASAGGL